MAQVETLMESDMLSTLKRVSPMPLLFQIDQIEIKEYRKIKGSSDNE
jgi:hypothetical protein